MGCGNAETQNAETWNNGIQNNKFGMEKCGTANL